MDSNVTSAKIASDAVTTSKIMDSNVTSAKIASNAITTDLIANSNVTSAKIGAGTVATANIANAAVTTALLADSNVTSAKIGAGTVVTANIADGAVTGAKIASTLALGTVNTTGDLIVGGSLTVNGTTTTINTQTLLIEDNIVTLNKNQTGTPPSFLQSGIEVERGTQSNYLFVFDEATDLFKVGISNQLQAVTTRDDVMASGFTYFDATTSKLINRLFTSNDFADGIIVNSKLATDSVTALKIADSNVTSAKIGAGTVVTANITSNAITSALLADSNVTSAKIGANTIVAANILDGTITSAKLAGGAGGMSSNNTILTGKTTASNLSIQGINVIDRLRSSLTQATTAVTTWTSSTTPIGSQNAVAWSPSLGLFVSVGTNGQSSPNGITWTSVTHSAAYTGLCWSPERSTFIACTGTTIARSSNGTSWTTSSNAALTASYVCWSPELSRFCAVGSTKAQISSDGITWTTSSIAGSGFPQAICWSPELSLFCAVGTVSPHVVTSPDGITWTSHTQSGTAYSSVCWSPTLRMFCAVSNASNVILTSANGTSWTTAVAGFSANGVTWSTELGLFVAVSLATNPGGTTQIRTSPDSVTWTVRTTPTFSGKGICYAPELGICCSPSGGTTLNAISSSVLRSPQTNIAASNLIIDGTVGIGTSNPVYKLQVVGDIQASGNIIGYSDARFKTDLQIIEEPLNKIDQLHGYTYKRIDIEEEHRHVGLIAQELEKVLPEAVVTNPEGYKSVAYGNVAALFVEAIRELNAKVDRIVQKNGLML
jgi:hypothetical protein